MSWFAMKLRRGRPTRVEGGARSNRRMELRLTDAERRSLDEVAKENGLSLAALVREAINEFVQDYRERPILSGNNSRPSVS